jgi:hypothetical protein
LITLIESDINWLVLKISVLLSKKSYSNLLTFSFQFSYWIEGLCPSHLTCKKSESRGGL